MAPRSLGRALSLHVVRELIFPTFFALVGITLISILAELFAYSDLVVNRGFGLREVAEIALLRALPMVGRAIPYSVMIGALVALGRMVADREILVIQASGISPQRLVVPVALFAGAMGAAAIGITAFAEPHVNALLAERIQASVRESSGLPLRGGIVTQIGDWRLIAHEVSSHGDRLRGVAVWVPPLRQTVFAERAELSPPAPDGTRQIDLENGMVLRNGEDGPAYMSFHEMRTAIDAAGDREMKGAIDRLPRETLAHLAREIRAERDPRNRRVLEADWHRRLALPVATLCFGALAVPLALRPSRLSRSSGLLAGIGATLVYAALLQLSNGLVQSEHFPVALGVWLPDLALIAAGVALIAVPSGVGIGRLFARNRNPDPDRSRHLGRFVLARYLLVRFVEIGALCFAGLLVAMVFVDIVDNLQWFTKYRSTLDEVARFYAARLPLIVSRVVPIALLVASALTVSLLGVTGELIGMRACGISAMRIAVPILLPCMLVAVGYRVAVDQFVPHAAARATQIKRVEIKAQQTERLAVWLRDRDHLYQADRIDPLAGVAQGITIYELDAIGLPKSRTDAARGRHVGEGTWHLGSPRRVEIGTHGVQQAAAGVLVKFGDEFATERDGAQLSVAELREEIDALEARGFDATAYRVDLQAKHAAPFACVVLPALVLVLATSGPPFRTPAQILLISIALMILHFLLSALCVSLGYRSAVTPGVAGWGTTAIFAFALAGFALARMRRSGAIPRPQ